MQQIENVGEKTEYNGQGKRNKLDLQILNTNNALLPKYQSEPIQGKERYAGTFNNPLKYAETSSKSDANANHKNQNRMIPNPNPQPQTSTATATAIFKSA
jgi:hypothetical protein